MHTYSHPSLASVTSGQGEVLRILGGFQGSVLVHSWSGGGVDIPRTGLRAGVAQLSSGAASSRPGAGLPATLLNTTNLSEPLGNLEWGTLVWGEEELGLCPSRVTGVWLE